MAILLDGERLSQRMKMEFGDRVARLHAVGRTVGLATVLVGDDGPSAKFVAMKHADCAAIGIESIGRTLPATATQRDVEAVVDELNADPAVHAILVQLPLPAGMNEEEVLLRIDPRKDADGLHPVNLGKMLLGAPGPLPCTPVGIIELLAAYEVPVEGRHVVIVGRGTTIGRPLSVLLSSRRPGCNAAVTQVHTGVASIGEYTRQADVIIAAAGSAGLITPEMVKPGRHEVAVRCSRGRRRGGGLDDPSHRWGWADDPSDAPQECGLSRGACTVTTKDAMGREFDERPWGTYLVLDDEASDHKVKRIVVFPGKRLSYQRHAKRAEHWFVVAGTAKVTLDGVDRTVTAGEAIDISIGTAHRIENIGTDNVVFVEVQHGTYFGEDDIVRLEDDYGRN